MWLSLTGKFRAKWSETIQEEWTSILIENRPDISAEQLMRTVELMNRVLPDACVYGHEKLIAGLELPDPNDRHVLAAAICGQADVIVTLNLKDFPRDQLEPFGIDAQHPDAFCGYLFDLDAAAVVSAARKHRAQLRNPKMDVDQYLLNLAKHGLPQTAKSLSAYRSII